MINSPISKTYLENLKMLALYKQYLSDSDIHIVDYYITICKLINQNPIIFTDKVVSFLSNVTNIPVFNSLYITKIKSSEFIGITSNEQDNKILNQLGIENSNIVSTTTNINTVVSQIKGIQNAKL